MTFLLIALIGLFALVSCEQIPIFQPPPRPEEPVKIAPEEVVPPEEEKLLGPPAYTEIKKHTVSVLPAKCMHPHVSLDSKYLVYSSIIYSPNAQVFIKDLTTGITRQLTFNSGTNLFPAISPDNKYVAFSSDKDGDWNIYITKVNNPSWVMQVTFDTGKDLAPSWSPDSKKLVYCHLTKEGKWEIRYYELYTRKMTILGPGLYPKWSPHKKPKDQVIAFQTQCIYPGEKSRVMQMSPDGTNVIQLVGDPKWHALKPAWSPDGKWLSFAISRKKPESEYQCEIGEDIWLVSSDGQTLSSLVDDATLEWYPVWGHERVFFISIRDNGENIYSVKPLMFEEAVKKTK